MKYAETFQCSGNIKMKQKLKPKNIPGILLS